MYKDTKIKQLVLYDMALCYKKINKLDLALESIEKYLISSNKGDNFYFYANILKANIYKAIGTYDIAIEIYNCLRRFQNLTILYSDTYIITWV